MTTTHIKELGQQALPYLVDRAIKKEKITYGELGRLLGVNPHTVIPHVLGYIRDEICTPRELPYLTALVVNKDDELPGPAFIPGRNIQSKDERRVIAPIEQGKVYAYNQWYNLLSEMGLQPVPALSKDIQSAINAHLEVLEQKGGAGEGEGHRLLKEYIAMHPNAIGLPAEMCGEMEYRFNSGDYCDIIFDLGTDGMAVVEIKKR